MRFLFITTVLLASGFVFSQTESSFKLDFKKSILVEQVSKRDYKIVNEYNNGLSSLNEPKLLWIIE